jgi:23S rRNA (guanosine2251-2'-O)-methyltransferase
MSRTRTNDDPLLVHGANAVAELLRSDEPVSRLQLQRGGPRSHELAGLARARGIAPEVVERQALDRAAGTPHHQGAVATTRSFPYRELDDLLAADLGSALVLDGVQDPRNLGAILRTARAAGVGAVVLPRDRSVGVTSAVVGASAGLVFGLAIARVPNLVRGMEALREAGLWTVGLVPRDGTPLYAFSPRVAWPSWPAGRAMGSAHWCAGPATSRSACRWRTASSPSTSGWPSPSLSTSSSCVPERDSEMLFR